MFVLFTYSSIFVHLINKINWNIIVFLFLLWMSFSSLLPSTVPSGRICRWCPPFMQYRRVSFLLSSRLLPNLSLSCPTGKNVISASVIFGKALNYNNDGGSDHLTLTTWCALRQERKQPVSKIAVWWQTGTCLDFIVTRRNDNDLWSRAFWSRGSWALTTKEGLHFFAPRMWRIKIRNTLLGYNSDTCYTYTCWQFVILDQGL